MREEYILAPGASGTEIVRSLGAQGTATMGLRVVSALELAKTALMKSGISITQELLTGKEEPSVIYSFLNSIAYFGSASYADAENLAASLSMLRKLIPENEEETLTEKLAGGEFPEKNDAIAEVYSRYMDFCGSNGRIDSISVIRKAISEAASFDAEFTCIKEFPLSPLEKRLLSHLSEGNAKEKTLSSLYGKQEKPLSDVTYTESYGSINEAEGIISEIYGGKLPLDSCLIACADSEYYQVFYDLSLRHDIPVTFGRGIPVSNSYPAELLKLLLEWDTTGYHGVDAFRKILQSRALDKGVLKDLFGLSETDKFTGKDLETLAKMCGNLRLSFDAAENKRRLNDCKTALDCNLADAKVSGLDSRIKAAEEKLATFERAEKLAHELEKGCCEFIRNFAYLRKTSARLLDKTAVSVIEDSIRSCQAYAKDMSLADIIPEILRKNICAESSREGTLHITSVEGALSVTRKNLFVCGLSSDVFPGSPKENYIALDSDINAFDEGFAQTSAGRILRKMDVLDSILSFSMASGCSVRLSFPGYNLAEHKDKNPSSVLFSIYEKQFPGKSMEDFRKALSSYAYFDAAVSSARLVGKDYSDGIAFSPDPKPVVLPSAGNVLSRPWSPSSLDIFFQCPRRFYLTRVLGIDEKETDDPFTVISPADIGTLAHSLMEKLAAKPMNRESFLRNAEQLFDRFLQERPPMHNADAAKEKKDFLSMMGKAYDSDPQNTVRSAEEYYEHAHPSGVILHGYPDRVEEEIGGEYLIADFKTKRKMEHTADDADSCFQVLVYAWLCEQEKIDISRCEYRYLRLGKTVSCSYNEDMKARLAEKLEEFKAAVESNDFPQNKSKENCRYCKLSGVCEYNIGCCSGAACPGKDEENA